MINLAKMFPKYQILESMWADRYMMYNQLILIIDAKSG